MLRTDLPKIITETVPGPKSQALIDRRKAATPSAIGCVYPVAIARGEGAMIGLELVKNQATKEPDAPLAAALIQECAKQGLLIENAGTYGNVIRFLAPLVITEAQLAEFTDSVMENQGRLMANNFVELDRARVYKIYKELL